MLLKEFPVELNHGSEAVATTERSNATNDSILAALLTGCNTPLSAAGPQVIMLTAGGPFGNMAVAEEKKHAVD